MSFEQQKEWHPKPLNNGQLSILCVKFTICYLSTTGIPYEWCKDWSDQWDSCLVSKITETSFALVMAVYMYVCLFVHGGASCLEEETFHIGEGQMSSEANKGQILRTVLTC